MGLSLSHGDYSKGYSALNSMRNYMMQRAGYGGEIKGHKGGYQYWQADINWEEIPRSVVDGDWGEHEPKDILFVLCCHSDCDGEIYVKHLKPLADRMKEVLLLPEKNEYVKCYDDNQYNISVAECFIEALEDAHNCGENLMFH